MLLRLIQARTFLRRGFRDLHDDENGAVMVVAIAFSVVLVGMLWAVISLGNRVEIKEGMQGSADTAAFSAAVIMAKGMNIISFLNIIVMVCVAMVVLAQLLTLPVVGAIWLMAEEVTSLVLCDLWFCSCGCWIQPHIPDAIESFGRIYSRYSQVADDARSIGRTMTGLQDVVYFASWGGAMLDGAALGMNTAYGPGIVSVPIVLPPPIERVDSSTLCRGAEAFQFFERNLFRNDTVSLLGGDAYPIGLAGFPTYSSDPVISGMITGNLLGPDLMGERAFGSPLCHNEMGGSSDLSPYELRDGWRSNVKIRSVSLRADDGHEQRIRNVSAATFGHHSSVMMPFSTAFAQAQYLNANVPRGNDDAERMYQMDWHGMMTRFRFTDGGATFGSGISGIGDGIMQSLLTSISPLLGEVVGADNFWLGLQDGLILH